MSTSNVQRAQNKFQAAGQPSRVVGKSSVSGLGRHGCAGSERREGEDAGGSNSVSVGVEFCDRRNIALDTNSAAHNDELLDFEERFGVLGCGESYVGQRTDGKDGDGVGGVLL